MLVPKGERDSEDRAEVVLSQYQLSVVNRSQNDQE
jgi:hypothetical protein